MKGSEQVRIIAGNTKVSLTLSPETFTYDGKVKTPAVTAKEGSEVLKEGTDYTVSYAPGRKNAGTYNVTVILKGSRTGSVTKSFLINKADNPLSVKPKVAKIKYSKLRKKAQNLAIGKVITFDKKGQGKISYTIKSVKNEKKNYNK